MPFDNPGLLTYDQVYAVSALILNWNGIIGEHEVMDASTLAKVKMPNRDGFVSDTRPDTGKQKKKPKVLRELRRRGCATRRFTSCREPRCPWFLTEARNQGLQVDSRPELTSVVGVLIVDHSCNAASDSADGRAFRPSKKPSHSRACPSAACDD